ncbi:MAG TPA: hypothetical protein VN256_13215 [Pyrinomonadaceae bacterium]|nr:hypothetical protein [Pyrinomonadaceae bacterium]
MAFTLKQWINRASDLALSGEDLNVSAVLDPEQIAESWAHHVMREVAEEFAADPMLAPYVTETVTIALTNGAGTLPSRVLEGFISDDRVVLSTSDATVAEKMRFLPWDDFIRAPADTNRGYFSVKGTSFYYVAPGSAYTPGSGVTGNVDLTTFAAVDMPASESATITCPLRLELALVERLATKIRVPRRERVAA